MYVWCGQHNSMIIPEDILVYSNLSKSFSCLAALIPYIIQQISTDAGAALGILKAISDLLFLLLVLQLLGASEFFKQNLRTQLVSALCLYSVYLSRPALTLILDLVIISLIINLNRNSQRWFLPLLAILFSTDKILVGLFLLTFFKFKTQTQKIIYLIVGVSLIAAWLSLFRADPLETSALFAAGSLRAINYAAIAMSAQSRDSYLISTLSSNCLAIIVILAAFFSVQVRQILQNKTIACSGRELCLFFLALYKLAYAQLALIVGLFHAKSLICFSPQPQRLRLSQRQSGLLTILGVVLVLYASHSENRNDQVGPQIFKFCAQYEFDTTSRIFIPNLRFAPQFCSAGINFNAQRSPSASIISFQPSNLTVAERFLVVLNTFQLRGDWEYVVNFLQPTLIVADTANPLLNLMSLATHQWQTIYAEGEIRALKRIS